MKLGLEVEGRFKGLRTLFMSADEARQILDKADAIEVSPSEKALRALLEVQAVYISDHDNTLSPTDAVFDLLRESSLVITIEVTKVFQTWPEDINLMLTVDSSSFWFLRDIDQVKFSKDQNVYAVTKENMSRTHPNEFYQDIEL